MNKKIIAASTFVILAIACFSPTGTHASEITGTLSSGVAASSGTGSQVSGTLSSSIGGGSTITGTVGGSNDGSNNTGGSSGGGGGSVLGATVGSGTGSSPVGQVLGVETVPGLPNTGEKPDQTASPWNVTLVTILAILSASSLMLYIAQKKKALAN